MTAHPWAMGCWVIAALGLGVTACGAAEDEATMHVQIPWNAALSAMCMNMEARFATMEATLRIGGGYTPCDLVVANDLSVSGTCPQITVGLVRPLMLVYSLPLPNLGGNAQLAYHVGWVDLQKESLQPGQEEVVVSLDNGVESCLAHDDAETDTWETATNFSDRLNSAKQWAFLQINAPSSTDSLNIDEATGDNCSNIVELCNPTTSTLDTIADNACP